MGKLEVEGSIQKGVNILRREDGSLNWGGRNGDRTERVHLSSIIKSVKQRLHNVLYDG